MNPINVLGRMTVLLTVFFVLLHVGEAAMAGTNAVKLRRPRVHHRHYHEAAGSSPSVHEPISLEQAIAAARKYKAKPITTPIVKRMSEDKFMTSFDACMGGSLNSVQADECQLALLDKGWKEVDEAGGWEM